MGNALWDWWGLYGIYVCYGLVALLVGYLFVSDMKKKGLGLQQYFSDLIERYLVTEFARTAAWAEERYQKRGTIPITPLPIVFVLGQLWFLPKVVFFLYIILFSIAAAFWFFGFFLVGLIDVIVGAISFLANLPEILLNL